MVNSICGGCAEGWYSWMVSTELAAKVSLGSPAKVISGKIGFSGAVEQAASRAVKPRAAAPRKTWRRATGLRNADSGKADAERTRLREGRRFMAVSPDRKSTRLNSSH